MASADDVRRGGSRYRRGLSANSRFLQFFRPGWEFVAAAIVLRVVHATGNALVITATFSFTAIEFQDCVGIVFVRVVLPIEIGIRCLILALFLLLVPLVVDPHGHERGTDVRPHVRRGPPRLQWLLLALRGYGMRADPHRGHQRSALASMHK